jgi:ribulose-bisphosphate carboxylase small chain
MWGLPQFDLTPDEFGVVMRDIRACLTAHPDRYVKLIAYDSSRGRQTTALSFIVGRPADEPGFGLERTESHDRVMRYRLHSYATEQPPGRRYQGAPPRGSKASPATDRRRPRDDELSSRP